MNEKTGDIIIMTFVVAVFMCLVFLSDSTKCTYLVKRLDTGLLQRYEFYEPQLRLDTVTIYDEILGADGPIYFPVKAVIQDTIL